MKRALILLGLVLATAPARAQLCFTNADGSQDCPVRQSQVPQPAATVPPGPSPLGSPGSAPTFPRSDAVPPSLTRSTTLVTASDGTFSLTWPTPLVSATPIVVAIPINTGSQPVLCNITARNAATVSGRCWQAATQTLGSLATIINIFSAGAGSMPVMVLAREPTQ